MRYRRSQTKGGTWFFTVNLLDRKSDLLIAHIGVLRSVVRKVRGAHPFEIIAMVVLPDHLHAIWHLPADDADYPMRWSLIKAGFGTHVDYIHFNPVKHGHVSRAADWPHSSIHQFIRRGWIAPDWGCTGTSEAEFGER